MIRNDQENIIVSNHHLSKNSCSGYIHFVRRMTFLFMAQRSKLLRGFGNLLVRTEARRMKIFMAFSKDGWVTKIPPHSYGGMMR